MPWTCWIPWPASRERAPRPGNFPWASRSRRKPGKLNEGMRGIVDPGEDHGGRILGVLGPTWWLRAIAAPASRGGITNFALVAKIGPRGIQLQLIPAHFPVVAAFAPGPPPRRPRRPVPLREIAHLESQVDREQAQDWALGRHCRHLPPDGLSPRHHALPGVLRPV
jgi:hypothetical protein